MNKDDKLILFKDQQIRRTWHEDEWFYSVVDIVAVLTESPKPRQYWGKLKQREFTELQLSPIWVQLKLASADGKKYKTDCVNTKNAFRLIQSIPSKKAEPFKMWLAQLGKDRIDEIEDPALAQERMKAIYEQKGYPKSWIDKRLRGMAVRQTLTDEWKERGVDEQREYAILTAEISKATFGMTPSEYKNFKNIPVKSKANLRDNMTDLELIFTMLGEASTTEITRKKNALGFDGSLDAAREGGAIAGDARAALEQKAGDSVISKENYLSLNQNTAPNELGEG